MRHFVEFYAFVVEELYVAAKPRAIALWRKARSR